jgi:hypothetical protein
MLTLIKKKIFKNITGLNKFEWCLEICENVSGAPINRTLH